MNYKILKLWQFQMYKQKEAGITLLIAVGKNPQQLQHQLAI
jgi:hypothetical protein